MATAAARHDTETQRSADRTSPDRPSFAIAVIDGGTCLTVRGEWSALTVGQVETHLRKELAGHPPIQTVDLEEVTRLDTTGALLLQDVTGGTAVTCCTGDASHRLLLDIAADSPAPGDQAEKGGFFCTGFLHDLGKTIVEEGRLTVQMVGFFGEYLVTCLSVCRKPLSLPFTSLVYHMQQVGVSAVPIVALLSFLIGLVIAYMGAQQLAMFGAEIFTIKLVEIITLRELGVMLTAIVIAGRSGSSFTAQIGAMVSNEEVAAMRTMGLSPMLRLAFPRITALLLMLPALVFLSDIMGILGGGVAALSIMDMTVSAYAVQMQTAVNLNNFLVGMVKAPFFAVVIGVIGCFQGFQVTGSAESVGRLTTRAVVEAIFAVILLDALFALFFTGINV